MADQSLNSYDARVASTDLDHEEHITVSPRVVRPMKTFWIEEKGERGSESGLMIERDVIKITDEENMDIQDDIDRFNISLRKLKRKGLSIIYPEQVEAGKNIIDSFTDDRAIVMLLALGMTQSGKTGVMVSSIEQFTNSDSPVPIENVFIISGLSSIEWKEQTKARVPVEMHGNIFHRPQLKREFMKAVQGKKNVLILIDEVQIACKENQTISSALEGCGFLELQNLLANDIKIVEFSATPNGTLYDTDKWNNHSTKVKVLPGEGYKGCIDLLEEGRVFKCEPLNGNHFTEVEHTYKKIKEAIDNFTTPRYHIIRTPTGAAQGQVITYFSRFFGYPYKKFDMTEGGTDINDILSIIPEKHTFIFIKEKARCAKTFYKKHIGIWYERSSGTMMDDVVTQGLLGRATGYDDNGDSLIFTNIDSINKYKVLWESNFEADVQWNSGTTLFKKEGVVSLGTFNRKVKNGGVRIIPEDHGRNKWNGLPDTHEIKEEWISYEGDGTIENMIHWFSDNSGHRQHNPFKKMEKNGDIFASPMLKFGKKPILKEDLQRKVTSWTNKNNNWVIESFSISAEDVNNPEKLPKYGQPIIKKAYVCYESFEEEQSKKPILYIRSLVHK